MAFFSAHSIVKAFGGTLALDHAEIVIQAGAVHSVLGENGSGKSTLMRIAAGAHALDSGSMELNGSPYLPRNPMDARRAGVSMIHQELSICNHLSVAENVVLGTEPSHFGILARGEIRRIAQDALAQVGHPDIDLGQPAGDLPLALRQLVEIARAVAAGSRMVIFDEPTSSLTKEDVHRLFKVIERLKADGVAVIYVSHFLEEVRQISDEITILRDGKTVATGPLSAYSDADIVSLMVGRTIADLYPRAPRIPGDSVLSLRELTGARDLPSMASLELFRGEVLGIAGLNGSGRTELLRAIFGLDTVKKGKVTVGKIEGFKGPEARWNQGVGMLSENRKEEGLFLNLSISDNTTMTRLGGWRVDDVAHRSETEKLIERLRVKCRSAEQAVGELSGGNQQKVALARLLYHDVDIWLLDEPTRGIDVGSKQQIYELINELAARGKSVLVVSSYLPELLGICDRIAVMRQGELRAPVDVKLATQESLMEAAIG